MSSLSSFRQNVYSQNGEDGVVHEILRRLEIIKGQFAEFGAWDGKHLSNTRYLLEQGWGGVYIEGDRERFQQLTQNMQPFAERVELINAYVEPGGKNTLDSLLARTRLRSEFEVLSIDIDSFDWQVWERLKTFDPTIVIIEINSGVPVGIYQTHRGSNVQGSSFTATVDLGTVKGYAAVCHTGNLIFVRNNAVPLLKLPEQELGFPETLFDYSWTRPCYAPPTSAAQILLSRIRTTLKKMVVR
jgi:hypothetical protein